MLLTVLYQPAFALDRRCLLEIRRKLLKRGKPDDAEAYKQHVVEQALTLIPSAEGAAIFRADGDMSTCVCASGNLQHSVGTLLPLSGSLSGLALRTGETLA